MSKIKYFLFLILFLFTGFKEKYPDDFNRNMEIILFFEGGLTIPGFEPEGLTNYGITQSTYNFYNSERGLSNRPVDSITMNEVYDCYYKYYYLPAGCDTLPPALSLVHFDISVNSGVVKSKKLLLLTLKDEKMSDSLDKKLALKYIKIRKNERYEIVKRNEKKRKYLKGWIKRDDKLEKIILDNY